MDENILLLRELSLCLCHDDTVARVVITLMSAFPPSVNRAGLVILTVHGVKKQEGPGLRRRVI